MPGHNIIVVGASAGGVEALSQLVSHLPEEIPAAIFVVLHIPSQSPSILPKILNRAIRKSQQGSRLRAAHPCDGDKIEMGQIYVAPPDRHLLVKNGYIHLARGPKENSTRPAIDPLFRTAARTYGRRVVGVVLSGTLDDGTAGLMAVKQRGGVTIVQDPDEALYSGMPQSAIENVDVNHVLRVAEIATLLAQLANQSIPQSGEQAVPQDMEMEADMAELELAAMQNPDRPGTPSPFACPDCGGVLWEIDDEKLVRFRCRTGHAFSPGTLLAQQSHNLEEALWNALRALEEKAALSERLAKQAQERQRHISSQRFDEQASAARQQATLVRQLLLKGENNGKLSTVNGDLVGANGLVESGNGNRSQESEVRSQKGDASPLYVVAVCASGGGLNAMSEVLSALPADFPAAITVVQQLDSQSPRSMADLLSRRTALRVKLSEHGDLLRKGTVYITPDTHHLLVNSDQTLSLFHSEFVHFVRPSADLLFESVAASFKRRAIAVVLTDQASDCALGVQAIKQMGGVAIACDSITSEFFGMPQAAINTGNVDLVVPLHQIAATLLKLVMVPSEELQES